MSISGSVSAGGRCPRQEVERVKGGSGLERADMSLFVFVRAGFICEWLSVCVYVCV